MACDQRKRHRGHGRSALSGPLQPGLRWPGSEAPDTLRDVMATYQFRCPECDPRVAATPARTARDRAARDGRRARRQPARIRTDQGLDRYRLREDAVWDVLVVPAATAPGTRRRPSSALRSTALPLS